MILEDCQEAAHLHQDAFYKGWKAQAFQELLQNPLTFGLKIEENHRLCGYIVWREVEDEAEILTLVVTPSSQRQGRGTLLLSALFQRLIKKGIQKLFLEVAEDNYPAQSFYLKQGFILLNQRPHYYPREGGQSVAALNFFIKFERYTHRT